MSLFHIKKLQVLLYAVVISLFQLYGVMFDSANNCPSLDFAESSISLLYPQVTVVWCLCGSMYGYVRRAGSLFDLVTFSKLYTFLLRLKHHFQTVKDIVRKLGFQIYGNLKWIVINAQTFPLWWPVLNSRTNIIWCY